MMAMALLEQVDLQKRSLRYLAADHSSGTRTSRGLTGNVG